MDKKFLVKFALKNLFAHPLRSFLTIIGITIGISAIIFLVGFAFGLEKLVTDEVTKGDAFKLVDVGTGNSLVVNLNQKSVESIKKLSGVKNVEVISNAGGKIKANNSNLDISFYGTSPTYLDWLGNKIALGKNLPNQPKTNQVLVTKGLVKTLTGDEDKNILNQKYTFDIILPKELNGQEKSVVVENKEYEIVGIIDDDSSNSAYLYYSDLLELGAINYSQAKVEVSNQNSVPALRLQIENLGFKTQYVGDTVSQITEIFSIFKLILASFGLIALIVASLGMFNTLTISLLERTKEIALMKILGMRRKDINRVFIIEALMFGVFGGAAGIVFGILVGKLANLILNKVASSAGGEYVTVFFFPFWFILLVFFFSFITGFLTGLYPAKRATRLKALDVLRYE